MLRSSAVLNLAANSSISLVDCHSYFIRRFSLAVWLDVIRQGCCWLCSASFCHLSNSKTTKTKKRPSKIIFIVTSNLDWREVGGCVDLSRTSCWLSSIFYWVSCLFWSAISTLSDYITFILFFSTSMFYSSVVLWFDGNNLPYSTSSLNLECFGFFENQKNYYRH